TRKRHPRRRTAPFRPWGEVLPHCRFPSLGRPALCSSHKKGLLAMEQKIRVMIVDDIPETRDNFAKLVMFERDIEVVDTAGTGSEALEKARRVQPDVVLMDINMPDMDGLRATEIINAEMPGI